MSSTILLLSSNKFFAKNPTALGKPFSTYRMAYITTAAKAKVVTDRGYLQKTEQLFKNMSINYTEIDIEDKNENELRTILKDYNAIYIQGGSTLYLMKAIKASGFAKVVREMTDAGVIYIGSSAGSMVCSPTIEASTWKHPEKFSTITKDELSGMNLVPFLLFVHYEPEYAEIINKNISESHHPIITITDDQAVLYKDGQYEILGAKTP